MAGFIRSSETRKEFKCLNTRLDEDVLQAFKDYCVVQAIPMNVLIEVLMRQYVEGDFIFSRDEIRKWKNDSVNESVMSTTINLEVYEAFKKRCKSHHLFLKHVLDALIYEMLSHEYVLYLKRKQTR